MKLTRLSENGTLMSWRGLRYVLIAVIPAIVLTLFLVAWYVPAGPSLSGGGNTGFFAGYVGNHYSEWTALSVSSPFVVKEAQVVVNGKGCHGTVRFVGPPVVGGYLAGVSIGGLPGGSVVGRRLTHQTGQRLDVVLTSSSIGLCSSTEVRFAAHSWWRTRWTTVPFAFSVNVTHRTGQDSRAKEASVPAL